MLLNLEPTIYVYLFNHIYISPEINYENDLIGDTEKKGMIGLSTGIVFNSSYKPFLGIGYQTDIYDIFEENIIFGNIGIKLEMNKYVYFNPNIKLGVDMTSQGYPIHHTTNMEFTVLFK